MKDRHKITCQNIFKCAEMVPVTVHGAPCKADAALKLISLLAPVPFNTLEHTYILPKNCYENRGT